MSKFYYKADINYNIGTGNTKDITLYVCDDFYSWTRAVCDENGESPCLNGSPHYCRALSYVLSISLQDIKDGNFKYSMKEIKWDDLPEILKKRFDIVRYRELHPLRLIEYEDKPFVEVTRGTIPEHWQDRVDRWLEMGLQPFDLITVWTDKEEEQMSGCVPGRRDNGLFLKDMYRACPICGTKYNYNKRYFNNLCPQQLAGSSGYYEICDGCGYEHEVIQEMS